jgi:hypothetical protein
LKAVEGGEGGEGGGRDEGILDDEVEEGLEALAGLPPLGGLAGPLEVPRVDLGALEEEGEDDFFVSSGDGALEGEGGDSTWRGRE